MYSLCENYSRIKSSRISETVLAKNRRSSRKRPSNCVDRSTSDFVLPSDKSCLEVGVIDRAILPAIGDSETASRQLRRMTDSASADGMNPTALALEGAEMSVFGNQTIIQPSVLNQIADTPSFKLENQRLIEQNQRQSDQINQLNEQNQRLNDQVANLSHMIGRLQSQLATQGSQMTSQSGQIATLTASIENLSSKLGMSGSNCGASSTSDGENAAKRQRSAIGNTARPSPKFDGSPLSKFFSVATNSSLSTNNRTAIGRTDSIGDSNGMDFVSGGAPDDPSPTVNNVTTVAIANNVPNGSPHLLKHFAELNNRSANYNNGALDRFGEPAAGVAGSSGAPTPVHPAPQSATNGNDGPNLTGGWKTVTSKSKKAPKQREAAMGERIPKVTPIQLQKMNANELGALCSHISTHMAGSDISVQRFGDNKHARIFCKTEGEKAKLMQLLGDGQVQYNSFNSAASRKRAFIVRGLLYENENDAVAAIRAAINALGIVDGYEIAPFTTPHQRHNPDARRSALYRLTVGGEINDQLLVDIRTMGMFGVRVEKMKKSAAVQCHRCQRYNHTTGQCHYEYRCVQCVADHPYGTCPRRANESLPIGCINCFDEKLNHAGHTANDFKNCPYFKKVSDAKAKPATVTRTGGDKSVSVKPSTNTGKSPITTERSAGNSGTFASVLMKGGASGGDRSAATGLGQLNVEQLTVLIASTVQSVLSSLLNGV